MIHCIKCLKFNKSVSQLGNLSWKLFSLKKVFFCYNQPVSFEIEDKQSELWVMLQVADIVKFKQSHEYCQHFSVSHIPKKKEKHKKNVYYCLNLTTVPLEKYK